MQPEQGDGDVAMLKELGMGRKGLESLVWGQRGPWRLLSVEMVGGKSAVAPGAHLPQPCERLSPEP